MPIVQAIKELQTARFLSASKRGRVRVQRLSSTCSPEDPWRVNSFGGWQCCHVWIEGIVRKGIPIVDDEPHVLEAIRHEMHDLRDEYRVFITSGCDAGLDIIAENAADILMPEKDEIQAIAEARDRFPEVKAIAMSGGGQSDAAPIWS